MALDPKKWTTKTQEAMAAAIDQAKSNSNPELTPDHVLAALAGQQDTIVAAVLGKLGVHSRQAAIERSAELGVPPTARK